MFKRKQRPASQQPTSTASNTAHSYSNSVASGVSNGQLPPSNGYSYGRAPPPPPPRNHGPPQGADPRLWQFFSSVDTDSSGAIDARELQRALINANWTSESEFWRAQ